MIRGENERHVRNVRRLDLVVRGALGEVELLCVVEAGDGLVDELGY